MESDLLMHGLGELSFWRSWLVSLHVARCEQCRRSEVELVAASTRMAKAMKPPGSVPRTFRPPVTVAQGWMMLAGIAVVMTVLILVGTIAVSRFRAAQTALMQQDVPCRPDRYDDKCR